MLSRRQRGHNVINIFASRRKVGLRHNACLLDQLKLCVIRQGCIETLHVEAGLDQVTRHRKTHVAQADETDALACHGAHEPELRAQLAIKHFN